MDDQLTLSLPRRLLSYLICSLIAFQPLLPAFSAAITPATQGTQVDAAGNGVPVINIATPNASGLSHNQYQNYNVGQEGLILNNATDRLTQTQLGGLIQNNPNLKAGQEARAIINEVVGANRSQLQGYTEVGGKAANVMVANPYGITCNGCGFINTPNVTLTTGKPQLDAQGNLQSLEVTKGAISIEGKGLDGSQADAVSIIARATEINAGIHARDLNVTLGANRVGADGSVTPIAGEGAAPSVAVDTGALGGMYANRIHLVSSENGVGVNLGNLNARQGDMVLDAQGRLSINNSLTSGTLTAKGSSIALQGEHKAGGNVALTAQQDIALTGAKLGSDTALDLNSQGQITLKGSSLTAGQTARLSGHALDIDNSSSGNAADAMQLSANAQLQNSGQMTAGKKLDLQAAQIINSGSLISQGDLQVRTSTLQQQGMLLAQGNNSVVAGQLSNDGEISGSSLNIQSRAINNGGRLLSTGDALISADSVQQRGTLSASNINQLNVTGTLNNSGEVSGSSLNIHSGSLLNSGNLLGSQQTDITSGILQQDGTLSSQGRLQLKVADRLSNSGELSGNSLDVTSSTLDNSGKMLSSGDALLTANRLNQDGTLSAKGNAAFNIADTFSNSGNMVSQRLQIDAPTLINSGEMMSHSDAVMNADTLQQNGSLTARGDAQLTARGWLENQGAISSQNALILNSAQLRNTGSLTAPNLTLTAGHITNSGLLQGTKLLSFHTGQMDNLAAGTISSDNDFALALPQLNNSGLINSGKTLTVTGDQLNNSGEINAASLSTTLKNLHNQQGGKLLADDQLRLQGDALINQGTMAAGTLNSDVSQITNSGTVQGDKALSLQGSALTNNGTLLSAGQLSVKHQTLDNSGLIQGKQLTVKADHWQNSGNALSEADADLQSDTLVNSGKILGQQGIALKSDHTDNSGWLIAQALTLRGDMINSGLIQGNQQITLQGSQLDNQQGGQLLSDGTLDGDFVALNNHGAMQAGEMTFNAGTLQNDGTVLSGKAFTAVINGALTNSGSLLSQQQMNLQAAEIDNQGTLAADNLSLHAPVLSNAGLLQGNSTLMLDHQQLHNLNGGQLIAGGPLTLTLDQLDNAGLMQVNGALAVNGNRLNNSGRLLSDNLDLKISDTLTNSGTGQIVTGQQADLQAQTLSNSGQIAAQQLSASGNTLENGGLLQGDALLDVGFAQTLNHNNGQLLSGDRLIVSGGSATNDGSWQGQQLDVTLDSLTNRGSINGISALRADIASDLINSGTLVSQGESDLNASTLSNSGKIMANRLGLQTTSLNNDGLLQGKTALTAQADNITQSAGGKTLSGGTMTLNAGQINTQGLLQGEQATVIADNWLHQGSLLGSKDLNVSISNELHNTGSLLSQDKAQVAAGTLNNSGSLLSEGAMTLNGAALNNSGSVQGKTLTITPASVINQGSLIGLQALTFAAMPQVSGRMLLRALAAPARQLINNQGGSLLTQGTLNINGDDVVNNGSWQGQQILLNARQLTNNGAIQSADALQLILADRLDAGAGSKISANGTAALQALTLSNQGEWIARNLTLRGDTLNNNGAVTGVEALTVGLNGALTQQQDKTLLSAGRLTLQSSSLSNAGRVQGGDLQITSGVVDNNGRLQGDNSLLINAGGRITNGGNGAVITQNALTLTAPELFNYGLIQGSGNGVATITGLTQNDGRWLSGGAQTLNTSQLNNNGWLQASQLILNATNASNNGTLLADGQGTFTGNGFSNQGTAQGGNLEVNYQQVNNSGTLLGNNRLSVMAAQVGQQGSGRLFSGGDLLVHSNGFDQSGQVVALGNATLEIANGFTGRDVLAAGGRLTVSSNGAIDNQGTMQGGALTLSAGGDLTNNGQLTTGSGDSALSGNRIAMNGNGSLQGGGNISLNSRSDITVDGFTGTLGNLTLSAPGSIVNTALLYAGGNLSLFANSIRNQRADMLAGGSMWLQGDAAGNANGEVINNSGTIETQNGDITINTGHLLNTRDGLSVSETKNSSNQADSAKTQISVLISELNPGKYGAYLFHRDKDCVSYGKGNGQRCTPAITSYTYAPTKDAAIRSLLLSSTTINVISNGSAARIASGRDVNIRAGSFDNQASNVLAQRDIYLTGSQLNNQSWQAGTQTSYLTYKYEGRLFDFSKPYKSTTYNSVTSSVTVNPSIRGIDEPKVRAITYKLSDQGTSFTPGELYRAVIQAGGNVSANFSGDISNTNTTANAGWSGNTLSAPALRGLTAAGTAGAQSHQPLATADKAAINTPQWRDQLQNALQQVNGAGALESASPGSAQLTQYSPAGKNNAALGKAVNLTNAPQGPASLHNYKAAEVDISAYPLPSGENGYFVASNNNSRYLITVNPKLNGLGQLDQSLFGELNAKLGKQPATTPLQETRPQYTDEKAFLGSSYMLDRLNLKPDYDYRFLGDAAFDTRYVSNAVLNQTGNRYINGLGSDLAQMRYLMDNAAAAQQSLGLEFGVSLSAEQLASLDKSMIWWEATTINGETVMVPKLYLSTKDVEVRDGSVIAGNNVTLNGGNVTNTGSSVMAKNDLTIDSQNTLSNLNAGLLHAGGDMQLSALNDINNVRATISGKKVALESVNGDINNLTTSQLWHLDADNGKGAKKSYTETLSGPTASITSLDSLSLKAGNDIAVTGANLKAGGDLLLNAWNDIAITGNQNVTGSAQSGSGNRWQKVDATSTKTVNTVGSQIAAGGNMTMQAGHDLTVTASSINAGKNAALAAGNDLNLNSATTSQSDVKGKRETHSTGLDRTTLTSGGDLALQAGRDINSQAAGIAADKDVALQAGRDVNLLAAETGSGNSYKSGKKVEINESVRQQGTEIASGGSTRLVAGNDITSQAATVTASKDLALQAGRDVNITTATESDYAYREETKTKKGFLKKTTTHTIQENSDTREKASQLSGNTVSVIAGNDLTVEGSSVAGDKGVALSAGNDLKIVTATNTQSTYSLKEVKKSGLMGGGLGLSYGKQSAKSERNGDQVTQSDGRSLVGAGNGVVSMTAGNNTLIKGSDVIAGGQNGEISVTAKNIAIVAGQDQVRETAKQKSKSSGFGLSLNLTPLDTVRNLRDIMNNNSSVYEQMKQTGNELGASSLDSPGPGLTYGHSGSKVSQNSESIYQSGSTLNTTGNLLLKARGDSDTHTGNILVEGSSLNAGARASLDATRNIDITTASDNQKAASSSSSKSWSATTSASIGALARSAGGSPNNGSAGTNYGSKNNQTSANSSMLAQHNSAITAGSVDLTSHKGDIAISGSTLTGTTGVSLNAEQGKISVVAGEDRQQASASGSDHAIGDLGGDGYSGTVGVGHNSWKNANTGTQQNTVRSGIVSTLGNVSVNAGKDVNLQGADVYAGNSLSVNGENIHLDPSKDTHDASSSSKSSQYGITAQVSGYGVSLAQAADKVAQSHNQSDDPRLQAIYAAQAAMTALSAYNQNTAAVKVTVSATVGSSHQSMEQKSTQESGSVLKAGGDVAITAKQDITGEGVKISGDNVSLNAGRDIALNSAVDSSNQQSSSGGSKYGVGVGFGLGGSQNGFSLELAASQNSANGNGNSITHHNSEVSAAGDLTVKAGQDVRLNGANLNGNHVDLNAGRNLEIASQQDRASYDSHQSSSGFSASICIPPICAGVPVQGSASMSGSKIYNDFDSVQQQSGISAGDGGYNIYVGNHTQLDGAIMASSATPDKNHLSTGTLGWTDIENHANAGGNGFSVAVSGSMGKNTSHISDSSNNDTLKSGQSQQSDGNSLPMGTLQQTKDRASSTTYSAISPGTIEIRNPDAQKQDVSQISRDTAAAENVLKDKFDVQKAEGSLAIQREMVVLGQQAIQQTFDALKKQEKEQERNRLKNDAAFNKLSEADQKKALDKIDQNVEEKYGIGSDLQIAAQAISGLFAGLAGGNVSGAVAAGAAPLLAQMVKQVSQGNEPMRVLLHTLASGLIAKAQGGSAIGGAAGGLTAGMLSYNDALSHLLYGKEVSELSADDRMLIANIVTLAGATAGGAVDGSAGVGSGAFAGRTEVENNYLSSTEKSRQTYLNNKQNLTPEEQKDKERLNRKDLESDLAVYAACNGKGADCQAERAKAKVAQDTYFNQTYQNPKEAQAGYQQIVNLLNSTDPNAKEVFNILEGYTQAFMSFGYTEVEAKARAGSYVGSIYIASGVSAVLASGALAKQFGKDVAPGTKQGNSTAKPIENEPNSSETYFRVEGGGNGTQTSQNRINVNSDGSVTINSGCSGQLCVSTNGPNHAAYYLTNRRQDGSVVVFEVDAALHKQIMDAAVPQRPIPGVPRDPDAPKVVDPTKGQPSVSLELPKVWDRLIEQNSSKARVLTKEEFLNEFNK
ncbi:filamentous hemagglutinin N-terminal domain-containing protein [Pantoea vagans]|uniref:Filamentous hemagglutinin N-terminal domain-containing protein n=1 Tax=Pantoea vagans TaxID=470934 RepID=A0ABY3L9E4_9GAMM|nr:filamentous hemagglutinin N-terminal domain-containing protein [Pantoea vagans]